MTLRMRRLRCVVLLGVIPIFAGGCNSSDHERVSAEVDDLTSAPYVASHISVKTGVFLNGTVRSLAYATPTRSGLTSVNGEFEYLDGEDVTFSVGGVTLVTARGSAQITPIDMFDQFEPIPMNADASY